MQPPRFWYPSRRGRTGLFARALWPIAALYDYGSWLRRRLTRAKRASVPVVCIGNLTVGGTGKTPVVIALAERLTEEGRKPFILTRGYGGRLPGPVRVDPEIHTAADVGDEPLLLARAAPVIMCADRPLGARFAIKEGADIILMDDGYQNPTLRKDMSIVVVDGRQFFGNGRVFPAGPLRENVKAGMTRADALIVMGGESSAALPLAVGDFARSVLRARLAPLLEAGALEGKKLIAFAGIGSPEKFFRTVRDLGGRIVSEVLYPDHHVYTARDIKLLKKMARDESADLITTEKDRVRLDKDIKGISTVPVEARFENRHDIKALTQRILALKTTEVETTEIRVDDHKRVKKLGHYFEAAGFFAVLWLFGALGLKNGSAFGGWIGRTFGPMVPPANRARLNLKIAFPEMSDDEIEATVVGMFDNLGRTFAEYAHIPKFAKDPEAYVEVIGKEHVESARAEGTGVLFVSGHFGNWELMPLVLRQHGGRGAEVYRAPNNPIIDDWLISLRARYIFPVQVPKGSEGGRALLRVVRAGEEVAMLIDQKMNEGIPVPFFGREAMTAPAAAALSIRYKIPIITARMERVSGTKFRLVANPPPNLPSTGDLNLDIYNLCVWLNEFLEDAIRERPDQWLWLHQRWGKFKDGKLEERKPKKSEAA